MRESRARASTALASRFSRARGTRAQVLAAIILFRGKERESERDLESHAGYLPSKSTKITLKKKILSMARSRLIAPGMA